MSGTLVLIFCLVAGSHECLTVRTAVPAGSDCWHVGELTAARFVGDHEGWRVEKIMCEPGPVVPREDG